MEARPRRFVVHAIAVLVVALATGCSPILYLVMRARHHEPRRSIALDQIATGSTDAADGERYPSCAGRREGDGDSDNAWIFTPPASARYEVRVEASYDAVLAISQEGRDGEIACNDDEGAGTDPRLRVPLEAGQRYVLLVDGYRGDHGRYALSVRRASDPPASADVATVAPDAAGEAPDAQDAASSAP